MNAGSRRRISFHLLLLIPLLLPAGCHAGEGPSSCAGPVEVRTRQDLAGLAVCHRIAGDLHLTGPALADLRGLEHVRSVRFLIVAETSLLDLRELSGLEEVAGITISRNGRLNTLHGLEGVRRLEGLVMTENPSLRTVGGLEGLEHVDALVIAHNAQLQDLESLSPRSPIPELDVSPGANPSLPIAQILRLQRQAGIPHARAGER